MDTKKNETMMAEQEMIDAFLPDQKQGEDNELPKEAQQRERDCAEEETAEAEILRREMKLLMEQHPELRERLANGEGLPQWLLASSAKDGVSLREAYAEHEMKQAKAEAEQLRRELELFKQNAAMGGRAPVKGAAGHAGEKGKDPFLEGLLSDE